MLLTTIRSLVGFSSLRPLHYAPTDHTFVVVRGIDELLCGRNKWVSRFEALYISTWWTGEQMTRLHGTVRYRQCGSTATKLSRLDAGEDCKVVCWFGMQAFSHNSYGVIDGRVDEAGMSTAAPDTRAVLCGWMHQGWCSCSQSCFSSSATGAGKSPQTHDIRFLRNLLSMNQRISRTQRNYLFSYVLYLHVFDLCEDLLSMETLSSRTRGEDIFVAVKNICLRSELDLKNLRGICTDGAPAMTGNLKGFVARFSEYVSK